MIHTIRNYTASDKTQCLAVFESNCPKFFDKTEFEMFINWLDHQSNDKTNYTSPTYTNTIHDAYFVIELPNIGVIGCGGFYITKDTKEARLAWGMIHSNYHKKSFGMQLYDFRKEIIKRDWPDHQITLGTSQHTYPFYMKMGMKIDKVIPFGYGDNLDRYDMSE